jgi:hypothetical protein
MADMRQSGNRLTFQGLHPDKGHTETINNNEKSTPLYEF